MRNLLHHRLHHQQIAQQNFQKPHDIAAWMGAMQAQDYAGAKWSFGLRLPNLIDADIEQAIANRTIVRAWTLRGTLHFMASDDVHWMLKLLAPRVIATQATVCGKLGLTETVFEKSNAIFSDALQNGNQLTRKELLDILSHKGIEVKSDRANYLFYRAGWDRVICHGPRRGNEFTYVLLQDWLPETSSLEGNAALAELAKRYFMSHVPATVRDFAWWSGQTSVVAKLGLDMVKAQLVQTIVDGKTYWMSPTLSMSESPAEDVYLLPGFDEYVVGYSDRSSVFPTPHVSIEPPKNGILPPVIIADGRVVGTWTRTFKRDSVVVDTNIFSPLTNAQTEALAAAIQRFGQFVERPLQL